MSHFNFENDMNNVLRMDSPLTQGPQMRWQRKLVDNSNVSRNESFINSSIINSSINTSVLTTKTPSKKIALATNGAKPAKTPTSKTPNKVNKTPGMPCSSYIYTGFVRGITKSYIFFDRSYVF